jgi:putative hydrolase of the HAD superfamily
MAQIKAIITDCYGVLTQDSWQQIFEQYFMDDPALAEMARHANHLYDKGQLSGQDFISEIAGLASQEPKNIREVLFASNSQNTSLLEFYKDLNSQGFKLAVLSNAASLQEVVNVVGDYFDMFDHFIISAEVGYIKPEPQIYQIALDKLGLLPPEVIFIDDRPDFVAAAHALGIIGVLYKNNPSVMEAVTAQLH